MTPVEIAAHWRSLQNDESRQHGVVLILHGRVTGWKDRLRDPQHNVPGVLAVDADGLVYVAAGGNDYDGAQRWEPVSL